MGAGSTPSIGSYKAHPLIILMTLLTQSMVGELVHFWTSIFYCFHCYFVKTRTTSSLVRVH